MEEHQTEEVFLRLPHRKFIFTVPKALQVFLMTEYFRRIVITLFLKKNLINEDFARNLLS